MDADRIRIAKALARIARELVAEDGDAICREVLENGGRMPDGVSRGDAWSAIADAVHGDKEAESILKDIRSMARGASVNASAGRTAGAGDILERIKSITPGPKTLALLAALSMSGFAAEATRVAPSMLEYHYVSPLQKQRVVPYGTEDKARDHERERRLDKPANEGRQDAQFARKLTDELVRRLSSSRKIDDCIQQENNGRVFICSAAKIMEGTRMSNATPEEISLQHCVEEAEKMAGRLGKEMEMVELSRRVKDGYIVVTYEMFRKK